MTKPGTPGPVDLVPSISVEALLQRRDAAAERIRKAHALLVEANALIRGTFRVSEDAYCPDVIRLDSWCGRRGSYDFLDDGHAAREVRHLDAAHWDWLLEKSGLMTFMDAKARDEWAVSISKAEVPELTAENIEATFAKLYAERSTMFERGVVALFRSLSWDYKTNLPVRFGRRLVLRNVVDSYGGRKSWALCSLDYAAGNRLDDLMRVVCVLDGKPEPDHRSGAASRLRAMRWPQHDNPADLGCFTVRGFRNGNAHISFADASIVDRMNQIIARHHPNALPPAREST